MRKNIYQQARIITNLAQLYFRINANAWHVVPRCRGKQIETTEVLRSMDVNCDAKSTPHVRIQWDPLFCLAKSTSRKQVNQNNPHI